MIIHHPKLNLSEDQLKFLWWAIKELGADLPSISSVKKKHQKLRSMYGFEPSKKTSKYGSIYYMNSISETIKHVRIRRILCRLEMNRR